MNPFIETDGYQHRTIKVSRALRDAVKTEYPAAFRTSKDGRFYNRLLQYLLKPGFFDEVTGEIILPAKVVAHLDGKGWTQNYNAGQRIQAFITATGINLKLSDWRYTEKRARTVSVKWPTYITNAQQVEDAVAGTERERVLFDTGLVYGRSRKQKAQEELEELVEQANVDIPPPPEQAWLLEWLNAQPERTITRLIKAHWDEALTMARNMPEGNDHERRARTHALSILDEVYNDCILRYRTSKKTTRIHAYGLNITQLPKDIRKTLLSDGVSLDLQAAQAALIAKLWGCPKLERMLRSPLSFWGIVLRRAKLPAHAKSAVKRTLYSAVFGMTPKNIELNFAKDLEACGFSADDAVAIAHRFRSSVMIKEILAARRRRAARARKAHGLHNAFDQFIPISPHLPSRKRQDLVRSALAQEIQSYEQKLMLAMVPILKSEKRVHVICWLHDGVVIKARDHSEQTRIVKRIRKAVNDEAVMLGIPTRLVVDA